MSDTLLHLLPLMGVLVGLLGAPFANWLLTKASEGRKLASIHQADRYLAYSDWLTASRVMSHQLNSLVSTLRNQAQHKSKKVELARATVKEAKEILAVVREALHSAHKLLLLDNVAERRNSILSNTKLTNMSYSHLCILVLKWADHAERQAYYHEAADKVGEKILSLHPLDQHSGIVRMQINDMQTMSDELKLEFRNEDHDFWKFMDDRIVLLENSITSSAESLDKILEILPRTLPILG